MTRVLHAECALCSANGLGEVPAWCPDTRTLWWTDVKVPAMASFDPATGAWKTYRAPGRTIGSWAFMQQPGALMLAQQDGLYRFVPDTGEHALLKAVEADLPLHRLNDGRCDRRGRFWVGSMHETFRDTPRGNFYRIDPDYKLAQVFANFTVPNSVAFSPDDRRMYFADTSARKIYVFDFDIEAGVLSNQRLFRDCAGDTGTPDGSTVDVDGCLWNAEYKGGRVVRYTPAGEIDTVIELPVSQPTACAFGGVGMDVLFITTGAQNLDPAALSEQPLAGGVFATRPGTQGLVEPRFGA